MAASFRGRAGFAHTPEIPPTVSALKVTPAGTATRSMMPSNGPRAAVPASLPFTAATLARRAVAARESCWLSGWTASQGCLRVMGAGVGVESVARAGPAGGRPFLELVDELGVRYRYGCRLATRVQAPRHQLVPADMDDHRWEWRPTVAL